MKSEQAEKIRDWFSMYVGTFRAAGYGALENIVLKENHCRRVSREIAGLGAEMGLDESDLNLAEMIGLLHDVGRFEQYSRYGTFVDVLSVNHARLGSRIIENSGVLEGVESSEREIIHRAIVNHSGLRVPPEEDERPAFFSRLLRDADKLDIWKVMLDYYAAGGEEDDAVGLNLPPDGEVSGEVLDDLSAAGPVDASNLRNQNDFKLLQIGWVYDINFAPSMRRVLERGYLEQLASLLPESEEVAEAVNAALEEARRRY
ncbi:MAG: HD domain-containing protein [Candidatus Krumholzibacteriales bacterium]